MGKFRERASFANVVSLLALFVALGGTAYAIGKNTIGPKQLKPNAVRTGDVKDDTLSASDVNESTLGKVPLAERADSAASADNASFAERAGDAATIGGAAPGSFSVGRLGVQSAACNPTSTSFVTCASVDLNLPRAGRVLLNGVGVMAAGVGNCQFGVDGANLGNSVQVQPAGGGSDAFGVTGVTEPLAVGAHTFDLRCNEVIANVSVGDSRITAVAIGSE